ncbi:MAG: tetratricopeptide repeat protein [Ignavibacteriae bacterium]|nr:tetratricopeptide repeat protein [Ignavibacteriota bacterium]
MNFIKGTLYGKKVKHLLSSASHNLNNKNYFSAIDEYTQVIEIDKRNPEAFYKRAIANFELERFEQSRDDFYRLEELHPTYNPLTNSYLSKIYLNLLETSKAAYYAEKYYGSNIENMQAQYYLARVKYYNGEYKYALELTDKLCEKFPEDFNIRYFRSLISYADKKYINAIVDIDKSIEITPINCFAFNLRGLINIGLENYKEALEDFEYAIRLNPKKAIYHFNQAKVQFKIGDLIGAKESLGKATELQIDNEAAHILKAEINIISENYLDALDDYKIVQMLNPENIKILERNAELKTYLFDYEGAERDLTIAIEMNDQLPELHFKLGHLNTKLGNYNKALEEFEKTLSIDKQHKEALLHKGILEFYKDKNENSIKTFDQLLALDPNLTKVALYKAKAMAKLNLETEVLTNLNSMDKKCRDTEYFVFNSKMNYNSGNTEAAIENISNAIEIGEVDNSAKLLKNIIKFESGSLDEMKKLDESTLENTRNIDALVLKGLFNFDNENYEEAKNDFKFIINKDISKEEQLKPFIEYVNRVLN